MNILMVASENAAFPNGKVGGIGDVIRDIPQALAAQGQQVNVVIPSYGVFSKLAYAQLNTTLNIKFQSKWLTVELYKVTFSIDLKDVTYWVLEHPHFAICGPGKIYCHDPDGRPFATDATKFALFSAAVAQAIIQQAFATIDIIHLHDWHSAMIAVLRAYDPNYKELKKIRTVFTIHNLALQGIRPFTTDSSSLETWFPDLRYDKSQISDPSYTDCFNPMRAGITLCDKIHTVSPNYAVEILRPSDTAAGFIGGEGLQNDLKNAADQGRLQGILNGCEYPKINRKALTYKNLLLLCQDIVLRWIGNTTKVPSAHFIAMTRINQRLSQPAKKPALLVTSIGRITDQKMSLLQRTTSNGETALARLLTHLNTHQGLLIILGSGDKGLEQYLTQQASQHSNLLFLNGYSESLSEHLYNSGDLFLMPSSFEPCGISQMLAMRAAQPCLAHSVGGLADTIKHEYNGFLFNGDTPEQQVQNLLSCFITTINKQKTEPTAWSTISKNAAKTRFLWRDAAQQYIDQLYTL